MLRISLALLIVVMTLSSPISAAPNGFISDNVYVYMHTGPSAKFRIMGSVIAGSKIEIVEKSSDKSYTKIIDDKGRTGWVQSEFASSKLSIKERFDALEIKFNALNDTRDQLAQKSSQVSDSNSRLEQRITQLSSQLATAKREKNEMEAKLVGEDADIQMKWLFNGGILVIISIMIGVLITFIPGKKKNKGNWA